MTACVAQHVRMRVGQACTLASRRHHLAPRSRTGHAKSDCPLHQAREASSASAIHRARHTASLATLRVLCCDHQALSESQQVIRHRPVRLPPCFAIRDRGVWHRKTFSLSRPNSSSGAAFVAAPLGRRPSRRWTLRHRPHTTKVRGSSWGLRPSSRPSRSSRDTDPGPIRGRSDELDACSFQGSFNVKQCR